MPQNVSGRCYKVQGRTELCGMVKEWEKMKKISNIILFIIGLILGKIVGQYLVKGESE